MKEQRWFLPSTSLNQKVLISFPSQYVYIGLYRTVWITNLSPVMKSITCPYSAVNSHPDVSIPGVPLLYLTLEMWSELAVHPFHFSVSLNSKIEDKLLLLGVLLCDFCVINHKDQQSINVLDAVQPWVLIQSSLVYFTPKKTMFPLHAAVSLWLILTLSALVCLSN